MTFNTYRCPIFTVPVSTHLFCILGTAACAHISQISELQSDQAAKSTATIHSFAAGYLTESIHFKQIHRSHNRQMLRIRRTVECCAKRTGSGISNSV